MKYNFYIEDFGTDPNNQKQELEFDDMDGAFAFMQLVAKTYFIAGLGTRVHTWENGFTLQVYRVRTDGVFVKHLMDVQLISIH